MPGFRILASNYLDISDDDHPLLFKEIESLIKTVNITAAQVAEEILRSEDPEIALRGVIELLKKKKSERTKMEKNDALSDKKTRRRKKKKKNAALEE